MFNTLSFTVRGEIIVSSRFGLDKEQVSVLGS